MSSDSQPHSSTSPGAHSTPPATCEGRHLICELYGAQRLADVGHVAATLEAAARACGATVLDTRLHPFQENGGIAGVMLLAESHVTIHTWPEHHYAAVDVFMCGDCDPHHSLPVLRDAFQPDTLEHHTVHRGTRAPTLFS